MKPIMLKMTLMLVVSVLFAAAPALADTIDFNILGAGGTWSFSGSGPLSLTANLVEVDANGGPYVLLGSSPSVSLTTGTFLGGTGTTGNPWMFGPSAPNSVDALGCEPPASPGCGDVTLFDGQFSGTELFFTATQGFAFIALDVSGTIDPLLAAFLGVPSGNYVGIMTFNVSGALPGGSVQSGSLTLTSIVPEPASLVLLAIGLVVVAGATRFGHALMRV